MNLLQKVAQLSRATKHFNGDYRSAFLSILDKIDLPETTVISDDEESEEDPEYQELDFENFGFSKVEDDEIIFSAGGDWQNPLMIKLGFNGQDIFVAEHLQGFEDLDIDFNAILKDVDAEAAKPKSEPGRIALTPMRKQMMRDKAITIFELTKGFTTESTDGALKSMLEMAGYVMELTNDL
jgi:hypothetical protein